MSQAAEQLQPGLPPLPPIVATASALPHRVALGLLQGREVWGALCGARKATRSPFGCAERAAGSPRFCNRDRCAHGSAAPRACTARAMAPTASSRLHVWADLGGDFCNLQRCTGAEAGAVSGPGAMPTACPSFLALLLCSRAAMMCRPVHRGGGSQASTARRPLRPGLQRARVEAAAGTAASGGRLCAAVPGLQQAWASAVPLKPAPQSHARPAAAAHIANPSQLAAAAAA